MGRSYAVLLALLAMLVVLARAVVAGSAVDQTLFKCVVSMAAFALVGLIVGTIAEMTIDESVRLRVQSKLDQLNSGRNKEQAAVKK